MHAVLGVDNETGLLLTGLVGINDLVELPLGSKAEQARRNAGGSRESEWSDRLFNRKWTGWSSSWLVLETNTDELLSKLITPSGFG